MKQKDFVIIIAVAIVSGVLSFILSGMIFGRAGERTETVQKASVIEADLPRPTNKYFNGDSIDPTRLIEIDTYNNQNPFNAQ